MQLLDLHMQDGWSQPNSVLATQMLRCYTVTEVALFSKICRYDLWDFRKVFKKDLQISKIEKVIIIKISNSASSPHKGIHLMPLIRLYYPRKQMNSYILLVGTLRNDNRQPDFKKQHYLWKPIILSSLSLCSWIRVRTLHSKPRHFV